MISSKCYSSQSRERYITAATYLSSRSFPSTLISQNPSLAASADSYPVLLPGVDSLNHARGQPVSWVVDHLPPTNQTRGSGQRLGLSLVIHSRTRPGEELLNNYGIKPNAELILGYGFSLEDNPDDTIALSIGGGPATPASDPGEKKRWEVGRDARGVDGVWHHVLDATSSASQPEEAGESAAAGLERQLDAVSLLSEMCQSYLQRLPQILDVSGAPAAELRPDVLTMFAHYIEGAKAFQDIIIFTLIYSSTSGQRDILESILRFAEEKGEEAMEEAQKLGIELELE